MKKAFAILMFVAALPLSGDDVVLTLPGEAKGAAMGEAYSATATGASALWYNPATLSRREGRSMSLMHTSYLEKITFNTLAFALPFGFQNAVGVGLSYLNTGTIPSYDNTGLAADSYSPNDICVRLGASKSFFMTSVGMSIFYLKSTIVESAATAGVNFGLHHLRGPCSLALSVENVGGKLKYRSMEEELPLRMRGGTSLRIFPRLIWNVDVIKPKTGHPWLATGTEYKFDWGETRDVSFRGGYNTQANGDVEGLSGFSAGAGFGFSGSSLNYAWVPFGDLGQTHRLSLDVQFGDDAENSRSERELRSRSLITPSKKLVTQVGGKGQKMVSAKALPLLPWKKVKGKWRTSKDKMIDLLARDALCSGIAARALITRTSGTVRVQSSGEKKESFRVRAGRYVFEGDTLTSQANASAHLVFANGVKAEVGPHTRLQIKTTANQCDVAMVSLREGEVYGVSDNGKEFRLETPLGDAVLKDAQARLTFDGKMAQMRVRSGSGTFISEGDIVVVKARNTFSKSAEGKTEKIGIDDNRPNVGVNITAPDFRRTPGRWDPHFAKNFSTEMMRLDSVPGLRLAEYIRDTTLRDQLKLQVIDMVRRRAEMESQAHDYRKDVEEFRAMKDNLKQSLQTADSEAFKRLKKDLKQTNRVLGRAQSSLKTIEKNLQKFLNEMRNNQEFLAAIPIVRMLNITAEESTIPFESGRAILPENATSVLDTVAASMVQIRPFRVVVEGHTDKTGSSRANQRLSKQRADAVVLYLRKKTSLPSRLFISKGMGSAQPLDEGDSPESKAKNRRVEIWFELRGL
ncbi:MAG: hypothetical protein KCHDKBKB_01464 [Elusimicrobia bacterium]|nr:hypothetical protein [Elusimicrobiota bacterium]